MITDDIPFGDEPTGHHCRMPYRPIYLSGKWGLQYNLCAIVNNEDYDWAQQWVWRAVCSKNDGNWSRKQKWYAYRTARVGGRGGRGVNIWLHKEILLRRKGAPPSPRHIIGDHMNGNSLDCRCHSSDPLRDNLRWATVQMNNQNYNGFFALQLRLHFKGGENGTRLTRFQERGHHHEPTRGPTVGWSGRSDGAAPAIERVAEVLDGGQCTQDHTRVHTVAGTDECPF